MIGEIYDKTADISAYQPSEAVTQFTRLAQRDYQLGTDILNRSWPELNDRSVLEDDDRGNGMFNAFVDTSVEDPAEEWKWRGTRSEARNKGIDMHANLTANFLLPLFIAQNEDDEVDQSFSEMMRDSVEWMTSPTVSNYQASYMSATLGAIKSPAVFLGAEWCEVMQTIRDRMEDGKISKKEVIDDTFSGFQAPVYSVSEILITNAYQRNIQKQRRIWKRRYCEYEEMKAKYGECEYWDCVQPGIRSVYNDETGIFYDIKDDENPYLVIEETSIERRNDSEVCFVNGIYMGDADVENNPVKHRDNQNRPKYNVVPFGFSRIGEHFFYYKSLMNAVGWDNQLYDTLSEIGMNRAILESEMPIAVSGSDEIDTDVIFPNSVVTLESPDARIQPLLPTSNTAGLFRAIQETKDSIDRGTVSETVSGDLPQASQKAYTVSQAAQASKLIIKGAGRSIAESMTLYGDLMKDIVLNKITVPQVEELANGTTRLKYRTLLLSGSGKKVSKQVKFDPELLGLEMTEGQRDQAQVELYEQTQKGGDGMEIIKINPELAAKFRYLTKVDLEEMFARNNEAMQAILLNLKTALMNDPTINQEELSKKLMSAYFNSSGDKFVKKMAAPAAPGQAPTGQPGANPLGQMVQARQLSTAAAGAGI